MRLSGKSGTQKFYDDEIEVRRTPISPAFTFLRSSTERTEKNEMNMINVISSTSSNFNQDGKISSVANYCENLTIYIKTFFKFAYYMCVSPFKFGKDDKGNFYVQKWLPQQILCGFMNVLAVFRLVTEVRLSIDTRVKTGKVTPVEYFAELGTLFSAAYKMVTMKRFWWNQNEYLSILKKSKKNFHKHCEGNGENRHVPWIVNSWLVHGIIAILTIQVFVDLITGKYLISDGKWHWTLDKWLTRLVALARYTFFFESKDLHPNNSTVAVLSPFDGFLGFVMAISLLQRFAIGFYGDLCIFSCAITTWVHANNFSRRLKALKTKEGNGALQWQYIYEHFQDVHKISKAVNLAVGSQTTLYIADSVVYYSLNLNAVMTVGNPFKRMDFIYFYLLNGMTFILAADIGTQMETVKDLITHGRVRLNIPQEEMNIVLHEMTAKDIGLRGNNAFTITFPFLAAVLSTVVTIFIISVQSNERNRGGGTDDNYLIFSKSKQFFEANKSKMA